MKYTKYTDEFKEEAVKLSDEIGVTNAAKYLGVGYNTLQSWRRHIKTTEKLPQLNAYEQHRQIRRLEQEIAQLKRANALLRAALKEQSEE